MRPLKRILNRLWFLKTFLLKNRVEAPPTSRSGSHKYASAERKSCRSGRSLGIPRSNEREIPRRRIKDHRPVWPARLLLILSILGFGDSSYLTYKHFRQEVPSCGIINGCDQVLTSRYASFGGIPLAFFGAGYYLALFLVAAALLKFPRSRVLNFGAGLAGLGFLSSLGLGAVQIFVLKEWCFYCLVSLVVTTVWFGLSLFLSKYQWHRYRELLQIWHNRRFTRGVLPVPPPRWNFHLNPYASRVIWVYMPD